ncbi:hypothetical protein FRC05_008973 [Tulasnella sp. 425]|nr:hypothetical protein FRC05_008973 [Tulasnella sp. 425]
MDRPQNSPSTDTDEKAPAQSSERRWFSRPREHRLVGFVPTAIVLTITLVFVTTIVAFLLGTQYAPVQGGRGFKAAIDHKSFVLNEDKWRTGSSSGGHLRVLTLSALASHLISDTSSILMTLVAYRVGAQWLRVSREGESQIAESPTAFQYGLIVRLMGSSSISAIGEGCVYAARSRARHRLPRLFKQALGMSLGIWIFARLVGLTDLWLHTTSKSILTQDLILDASQTHMFAAKFNETICPAQRAALQAEGTDPDSHDVYPCAFEFDMFVQEDDSMSSTGFSVMANESYSAWNVITLADAADLAILVPGPAVDTSNISYTYIASTFAIRADCNSLNSLCTKDATNATTNCTAAGYPQLPHFTTNSSDTVVSSSNQVDDFIFGVVNGQLAGIDLGLDDPDSLMVDNPATMAIQLRWNSRVEGDTKNVYGSAAKSNNPTDLAIDTYPQPTLYAGCQVSFFNASVRLDGARNAWSLLNLTSASSAFSTNLALPTLQQYATEHLASNLFATAKSRPKDEVMAALNQHLARLMLGATAGYFEPAPATDVYLVVPTLLGQYGVAPVLTLISLLCLYALLALLVFLSSWWTTDETVVLSDESFGAQEKSMLALAQAWLTSPAPLIGAALRRAGDQDGMQSVSGRFSGRAYEGNQNDARVAIGLTNEGFGIWSHGTGPKIAGVAEV